MSNQLPYTPKRFALNGLNGISDRTLLSSNQGTSLAKRVVDTKYTPPNLAASG
jgi:hypothetical protein